MCNHGVDVIPAHNGPKSGKRIVALRVNGSSAELYIETVIYDVHREFYYDSTISLPGGWQSYQNEKGFYDRQLSWSGDENQASDSATSVPSNSYSVETYPGDPTSPGITPDFGYVSEAVPVSSSMWNYWDELDDVVQTRSRVSAVKTASTRRVEVIRSKAERKLALDKDI